MTDIIWKGVLYNKRLIEPIATHHYTLVPYVHAASMRVYAYVRANNSNPLGNQLHRSIVATIQLRLRRTTT
ncbi:hypothetical protein LCGC14_0909180 [marine sediment metagenome]|uniref:Uncharacterized protein n=1 Tax=marine sediment metagenome TaxID=412755 RepID=A0A0F9NU44_9ZZZZ